MDHGSGKPVVFRNSKIYLFIEPIFFSILSGASVYFLSKNGLYTSVLVVFVSVTGIIRAFLSDIQYFLNETGLTIKKWNSEQLIKWLDINSMSLFNSSGIEYQIKTPQGSFTLPAPSNYQKFEDMIISLAELELEGVNTRLSGLSGPMMKRWHKKGREYEFTSSKDKFINQFLVSRIPGKYVLIPISIFILAICCIIVWFVSQIPR